MGWVSGDGPGPALKSGLEDVAQGRWIRSDDPLFCLGDPLQQFLLPLASSCIPCHHGVRQDALHCTPVKVHEEVLRQSSLPQLTQEVKEERVEQVYLTKWPVLELRGVAGISKCHGYHRRICGMGERHHFSYGGSMEMAGFFVGGWDVWGAICWCSE